VTRCRGGAVRVEPEPVMGAAEHGGAAEEGPAFRKQSDRGLVLCAVLSPDPRSPAGFYEFLKRLFPSASSCCWHPRWLRGAPVFFVGRVLQGAGPLAGPLPGLLAGPLPASRWAAAGPSRWAAAWALTLKDRGAGLSRCALLGGLPGAVLPLLGGPAGAEPCTGLPDAESASGPLLRASRR
jgi:hypothetical protein